LSSKAQTVALVALVAIAIGATILMSLGKLEVWMLGAAVALVGLAWAALTLYGGIKAKQPVGKIVLAMLAMIASGALWAYLVFVWRDRLGG